MRVGTTRHSLVACKMQPLEKNGVVDANLNVDDADRLTIEDLNIAPGNVAANTNAAALMLGKSLASIVL